tara:strand:+ start:397 stop:1143 length:747 start_codon:yes stop_codon:yes gene_type:complete
MIKAILVDDEKMALEGLMFKIKKQFPEIEIIETFQSPEKAVVYINENQPDILFLDIEMPVLSGFDVLAQIENPNFEIIFVTAYNDYAIEAFQHAAIGYVLKPIDSLELETAINNALKNVNDKSALEKNNTLLHHLINTSNQANKLMIPTNDGFLFVNFEEILHMEGYDGYTKIHLENTSEILSSYNIGKFEKMVTDNFYKCHKSHIINLHKVAEFKNEGYIILENRKKIPVSKTKRKEFLQLFSNHNS